MNRKKIIFGFCCAVGVLLAVVSCQKYTYDFTYSPKNPKAGERVTFTNISEAGESWVWKFGDGSQSTLKAPTHIYKAAGTYVVELMADSNRHRVTTHVLEVLDSVPTIYVASDSVQQYTPVTFKALLYNPGKSTVTYQWEVNKDKFVITQGSLTSDSIVGYFTYYGDTTMVRMTVTINGKSTTDSHILTLLDKTAPSIMMQTADGKVWRQRIYEDIYEQARMYRGDAAVIDPANDSVATLNGVTYDIHNMPVLADKQVNALQVDAINRKLYLILDDGLYVANANGDALTQVVATNAYTLLINSERNSIYWSTDEGVYMMPLVTNPQNTVSEQHKSKIRLINEIQAVQRMTMYEY